MAGRQIDPRNVYELMENDNGEIMVLLYAGNSNPLNPSFRLNKVRKCIELSRNAKDIVLIEGLKPESIDKLDKVKTLYVCEIKYTESSEEDSEILFAYPAELKIEEDNKAMQKSEKETLSEKAKHAREKALKKE